MQMDFFVYRNRQLLLSLISLKYRWIFFVWTETVTYFFLFYFFSYFFLKQIHFFVYRDHQLVLSFPFFLLLLYEIQINFVCIQRPSMHSFSFISSLIYLWNTDKFFFVYRNCQLILCLSFFSYFCMKHRSVFLYRDHQLILCLPFFSYFCMKYWSVNSFSYFFFHVFEVKIILFCRQRLSVSSFSFISSLISLKYILFILFVYRDRHLFFLLFLYEIHIRFFLHTKTLILTLLVFVFPSRCVLRPCFCNRVWSPLVYLLLLTSIST